MVNSSYTYSVFGLAFSMFAIGGLVYWLPTFLLVVHEMPPARVSSWLGVTVPAAMVAGMMVGGWTGGPVFADQPSGPLPRAGRGGVGLDTLPPDRDLRPGRGRHLPRRLHGRSP